METRRIQLKTLLAALIAVVMVEVLMRAVVTVMNVPEMAVMAAGRCIQAALILAVVKLFEQTLMAIGLSLSCIGRGVRAGIGWAIAFGGLVSIAGVGMLATGLNPLGFFSIQPEGYPWEVGLFYFTGVVIAPGAEELLFRGVIYGFFRRYGIAAAIVLTTTVFALLHLTTTTIPVIQAVGGVLFCIAYEKEKNLMAPVVIHMTGNGAIFLAGMVP